ncbi:transmembrane amino acid transporter [Colletotrichum asianum]
MAKSSKSANGSHEMAPVPSHVGQVLEDHSVTHDAVFGEITADGPNYRNVGWLGTSVLMMKTQIGLGVLSMPSIFDVLGIVPGVIILCTIAGITTWSDYMVGVFKLRHPQVYGMDDVGELLFGRIGREAFGAFFVLFFTFTASSAMIGVSTALNAVSHHGACTAIFVAVAAIASFSLASIRTLGRITWLAWVGVTSIMVAVFTVTIAVGLQDRPAAAPTDGVFVSDFKIINNPTFTKAISAISSIVFSYAGTGAFFPIAAEMRDPRYYTRALLLCQGVVTSVYVAVGVVVYYFCGSYVSSPALGSAGPLVKKVAYGLGLAGLLVSSTLVTHLASKHVFVRILRGSRHLTANTAVHWLTWLGSTFGVTLVAYLVASGIPVFNSLISLVGALLGTFMSFQPMGCMWLYDNWSKGKVEPTLRWRLMVAWSVFVIASGTFLMVAGTYSTILGIVDDYKQTGAMFSKILRGLINNSKEAPAETYWKWAGIYGPVFQIQLGNTTGVVVNTAESAKQLFLGQRHAMNSRPTFYIFHKKFRDTGKNYANYIPLLRYWEPVANAFGLNSSPKDHATVIGRRRLEYNDALLDKLRGEVERGEDKPCIQGAVLRDPESATLTRQELISVSLSMMAGADSNQPTLAWAILLLAHRPNIMSKAYEAIKDSGVMQKPSNSYASTKVDYIDALTKEIGRYFVVLKLALPKATYTDVTWGSATIPANTLVFLNSWACNRDSDLFAEPDVFVPERWLPDAPDQYAHQFAFGIGGRMCVASHLAHNALYTAFLHLIAHFEIFPADGQSSDEIDPIKGLKGLAFVATPKGSRARFVPRRDMELESLLNSREDGTG